MQPFRHFLLSARHSATAVAAAPAAADVWQIDPAHSAAQFSVTHLMISTVRGEFGKMSGTIEYDGKDVASIKVDATIDAATINTRQRKPRQRSEERSLLRRGQVPDPDLQVEEGRPG